MPNGIIIIDKPEGWTSMDVCGKLRGIFHERRIGHSGTLDPMATGVLPVFVGRATRAVTFASESDKEYIGGLKLGITTNTQDTTGEIQETREVQVGREQVEAVLEEFRGDILQIPPMYSAIKVKGKKLYELARKGVEIERQPRPVHIYELELLNGADSDYSLRIVCSKGTYVRTLCHDIGQKLGCGGVMSGLRRVKAAGFTLEQSVTLETVQKAADSGEANRLLLPVDAYFSDRPKVQLTPGQEKKVRNGAAVNVPDLPDGEYRVYGTQEAFLALCRSESGKLSTIKSFFEV